MKRISLGCCGLFTVYSGFSGIRRRLHFALAQDGISTSGLWNSLGPSAESFVSTLAREEEKTKNRGIFATGTGLVLLGLGALYNDEDPADEEDGKRALYNRRHNHCLRGMQVGDSKLCGVRIRKNIEDRRSA